MKTIRSMYKPTKGFYALVRAARRSRFQPPEVGHIHIRFTNQGGTFWNNGSRRMRNHRRRKERKLSND